jgi:hypothetical protein
MRLLRSWKTMLFGLLATTIGLGAVAARPAEACCVSNAAGCLTWEEEEVTVYLVTSGSGSLTALSPTRSAAEWEEIVVNAINIWRANAGIELRFRIVGSGTYDNRGDSEMTIAAYPDCSGSNELAFTEYQLDTIDRNDIDHANIRLWAKNGTSCNTINWANAADAIDATGVLVHELGHAVGLDHPDNACHETPEPKSVMHSVIQSFQRHLTRDDKFDSAYYVGIQKATPYMYKLNADTDTWSSTPTTFNDASYRPRYTPGTVSKTNAFSVYMTWMSGFWYTVRTSNAASWFVDGQVQDLADYDLDAVVAVPGTSTMRHYYLTQPNDTDNFKQVCHIDSFNDGTSWGAPSCVSKTLLSTQRSGLSAAYDTLAKAYVVVLNDDCITSGIPCNRIKVLSEPGPGSSLTGPVVSLIGHHSFWTPSIDCKPGSVNVDRCIIAFGTSEPQAFLRWQQGQILSNGTWSMASDNVDTSVSIDFSPSVAYFGGDDRFHLAFTNYDWKNARYVVTTKEKGVGGSAAWGTTKTIVFAESTYHSVSAPTLGTFSGGMRLYLNKFSE